MGQFGSPLGFSITERRHLPTPVVYNYSNASFVSNTAERLGGACYHGDGQASYGDGSKCACFLTLKRPTKVITSRSQRVLITGTTCRAGRRTRVNLLDDF